MATREIDQLRGDGSLSMLDGYSVFAGLNDEVQFKC